MLELLRHVESRGEAARRVRAQAVREGASLRLRFLVEADMAQLAVPAPRLPRPGEKLWQHTCCEAFVAPAAHSAYREFNFSPSGEWAGYAFTGYRQGGACAIPDPGIVVRRRPASLELEAAVPVPEGRLRVGLAAVLEDCDGRLGYWALRHAPGPPDFHAAAAFALEL